MRMTTSGGISQKTAFLFSGQGAQYVGMGRSLYNGDPDARHLFDTMECDFDIRGLCFDGPVDALRDTRYNQPCIFLVSMAIARLLIKNGIAPAALAGISLGEYSALCLADAFSVQEGVQILTERGQIMADLIPKDSGMAMVVALDSRVVAECCEQAQAVGACQIGSYLTPQQCVITGDLTAVQRCGELCRERGARMIIAMDTSGAFHSVLASDAAKAFASALKKYVIHPPTIPVYFNYDGKPVSDDIKAMEVGQLLQPIQFTKTIEHMLRDGITTFIAIGPGGSQANFVREIARANDLQVTTYVVDTYNDVMKLASLFNEAHDE